MIEAMSVSNSQKQDKTNPEIWDDLLISPTVNEMINL